MKNLRHFIALAAVLTVACTAMAADPVDYVNTMMGTMSKHSLSTGNTYPSVSLPWGMNSWTPMTGERGSGWAYTYTADSITGIKLTHQPSPWINDYGQLILMPFDRKAGTDITNLGSWFSHKAEKATPYYYSVYLADYDILAALAPTERAAVLQFVYGDPAAASLLIDAPGAGSEINFYPEQRRIAGWSTKNSGGVPENFRFYFVIETDCDWTVEPSDSVSLKAINFLGAKTVNIKVAGSFISESQASRNLREIGGRSLAEVASAGRHIWNKMLSRLSVEDNDIDHLRTFYSCLYRALLFPRALFEYNEDGAPVHYSPYGGMVQQGRFFTDTGFWDTFRSLFPLLNLAYPEIAAEMQEGLVNAYLESGFLPEWASPGHRGCMVGNNSASVVADAYLSGVNRQGMETLWEAVKHGANAVHPEVSSTGRLGYEYYNKLGYVPYDVDIKESAARTLEYAYDDWCIYQLGKALGKPKKEIDVYAKRAMNYKNLFDAETNLMRGRNADGSFQTPFNPLKWGDAFTEGNAWHYTWSVFHDPAGLARLMGGREKMAQMLDSVFAIPPIFDDSYYGFVIHEIREMQIMNQGNYAHGNQPVQHMIYLYDWVGQPWKAQKHVREVMDKFYTPTPDGYCGDEDNGQTSAWYVFSAMGFYPVCPGSGEYAIGSPIFKKVTIAVPGYKDVEITTEGSGDYINKMTVNGDSYSKNYITLDMLRHGTNLNFQMSTTPNYKRGTAVEDFPYSFSGN